MCRTVVAAPVRAAAVVAVVRLARPVIDVVASRAMVAAPAQLGVERVEGLGIELTDLQVPEQRRDVLARVAAVERQRVRGAVELVKVTLEELRDGRAGARVPVLGDLADQPVPDIAGPTLGVRPGGHDLDQVVPSLGDGVLTRVDAHAKSAAGQDINAAPLAASELRTGRRHSRSIAHLVSRLVSRDNSLRRTPDRKPLVRA
jgi:hypothetical protein